MIADTRGADVRHFTHRLENGLQLLGEYMPSVESASACFYVDTGARDEPKELMGVSHFLEHMMFKGTATRDYRAINRAFEEMGAENNAGTWLEFTYYWAKVLSDQTPRLLALLADMMRPRLAEEDFNQERNVILEEIARYEDMPGFKLFEHMQEVYFRDHPLSYLTLGTPETIGAMRLEAMRAYHARRYAPNNIIFSIAGKFDWEAVVRQIDELTTGWQQGEAGRTATPYHPLATRRVVRRPEMQQQLVSIATAAVDRSDPAHYAAEVLACILGDSTGSRLFWGVREQGLAESADSDYLALHGTGLLVSSATTTPELAPACLRAMQTEITRLQEEGATAEELSRAKTKIGSHVVMDGESTNRRMLALVGSWLALGRLETLAEVAERIEAVTAEDIRTLLDRLPLTVPQVIVALGPLTEEQLFADA
jgi:predicted Zn-dependent peptidase